TVINSISLHDALPISIINEIWNTINKSLEKCQNKEAIEIINNMWKLFLKVLEIWKEEMKLLRSVDILSLEEIRNLLRLIDKINRSEEHTSELQSRENL